MTEPTLVELESLNWAAGVEYLMDEIHDRVITTLRFFDVDDERIVDFMNSLRAYMTHPDNAFDVLLEKAVMGWIVKIHPDSTDRNSWKGMGLLPE